MCVCVYACVCVCAIVQCRMVGAKPIVTVGNQEKVDFSTKLGGLPPLALLCPLHHHCICMCYVNTASVAINYKQVWPFSTEVLKFVNADSKSTGQGQPSTIRTLHAAYFHVALLCSALLL